MKPVTGPDGDNPISDEQIRELRRAGAIGATDCHIALWGSWLRSATRTRCAAAWNARHGGG